MPIVGRRAEASEWPDGVRYLRDRQLVIWVDTERMASRVGSDPEDAGEDGGDCYGNSASFIWRMCNKYPSTFSTSGEGGAGVSG